MLYLMLGSRHLFLYAEAIMLTEPVLPSLLTTNRCFEVTVAVLQMGHFQGIVAYLYLAIHKYCWLTQTWIADSFDTQAQFQLF